MYNFYFDFGRDSVNLVPTEQLQTYLGLMASYIKGR